jgi:hypothetical protein
MATSIKVTAGHAAQAIITAGSCRVSDSRLSCVQLSALVDQIDSANLYLTALVSSRSAVDLTWRPKTDSWSVAECLDHIAQTAFAFLPAIKEAIACAPALPTNRALRVGTLARLFVRNLEPPYRIRLKVLPQLVPHRNDFALAWASFQEAHSQLMNTVCSASGFAIDRVKVKSPVYARIRYNIYGALCILAAHERRHLWQIDRTLQAVDVQLSGNSPERSH